MEGDSFIAEVKFGASRQEGNGEPDGRQLHSIANQRPWPMTRRTKSPSGRIAVRPAPIRRPSQARSLDNDTSSGRSWPKGNSASC